MKLFLVLVFVCSQPFCIIQIKGQRHHRLHRTRPAFSFQSFDQSIGFIGEANPQNSVGISTQLATQLASAPQAELQEQPQHNGASGLVANLPLYKQSYPGLYVKGHAAENFKYEPTKQVAHHHGPNYQIPRNIASSPQHDFAGSSFSSFN